MKSYSKLKLLNNNIYNQNQKKKSSLLSFLFDSDLRVIEVSIPYYDYLRANVLLADMRFVVDDCPSLTIADLIGVVYLQFLYQIRKGVDLKNIGFYLVNKVAEFDLVGKPATIEKLQESTPNTWVLSPVLYEDQTIDNPTTAYCTITIKEAELLRGEIFLHDLSNLIDNINFSLEKLISALFLDFIAKIKEEGNDEKVIRSIIQSYEYFKKK